MLWVCFCPLLTELQINFGISLFGENYRFTLLVWSELFWNSPNCILKLNKCITGVFQCQEISNRIRTSGSYTFYSTIYDSLLVVKYNLRYFAWLFRMHLNLRQKLIEIDDTQSEVREQLWCDSWDDFFGRIFFRSSQRCSREDARRCGSTRASTTPIWRGRPADRSHTRTENSRIVF